MILNIRVLYVESRETETNYFSLCAEVGSTVSTSPMIECFPVSHADLAEGSVSKDGSYTLILASTDTIVVDKSNKTTATWMPRLPDTLYRTSAVPHQHLAKSGAENLSFLNRWYSHTVKRKMEKNAPSVYYWGKQGYKSSYWTNDFERTSTELIVLLEHSLDQSYDVFLHLEVPDYYSDYTLASAKNEGILLSRGFFNCKFEGTKKI